ncbi:MAG: hypothetical protein ACI33P_07500 [Lysinibacillus sp.]
MLRKLYMLIFLSGALLIGGCGKKEADNQETVQEEQQSSTSLALQDDFTKEFIPSTEEAEEGYYTFESGVGGYTTLYPVNAVMD